MIHLSYLDRLESLTVKLKKSIEEDKLDSFFHLTSNRERLLKFVNEYEKKIIRLYSKRIKNKINNFEIEVFNAWKKDNTNSILQIKKKITF